MVRNVDEEWISKMKMERLERLCKVPKSQVREERGKSMRVSKHELELYIYV